MPSLQLHDGGHLVYDVYDFTDPWRPAETIVLVHGFSKNRLFWYKWLPALASRYRVICVDQRGHGDSSLPPAGFEMGLAPFAADLNEFAERLQLPPAHWVMAEFSSSVGVEFAIRYPHRLRSLVLPGFGYRWTGVDAAGWVKMVEEGGSERWARETNYMRLSADTDPGLRDWYIAQQSRVPAAVLITVFSYVPSVDLTDQLSKIPVPTLVIAGGASTQVPIETIKGGAERIPNCELVVLPDAPFNVMSSRPAESVSATLAFLERKAGH